MKILLVHNKYKSTGGEDMVVSAEADLLSKNLHDVNTLIFDNADIKTLADKVLVGMRAIYNPSSARKIKRKILEFEPDIIHVHNFVPLVSPSIFFVAKQFNIPVVVTLHNFRLICPSATLFHQNKIYERNIRSVFAWHAVLCGVYRNSRIQTAAVAIMTALHSLLGTWKNKVDLYITLTSFSRKMFLNSALSIPEDKLVIKPNFIEDYGCSTSARKDYYLFVGRLTEEKGIMTLLQTARVADFKLVVIGDGPLRNEVTAAARENPNITYLGFQEKGVVLDHMKSCRALIFPSLWYECFPITMLEALAAGTIVIASRLGGMAEIIRHRVNGLHFESGNVQELVSLIREINSRPQYLKKMAAAARSSYLENYTPEKNYVHLLGIYFQALKMKKRSETKLTKVKLPALVMDGFKESV